jgi:hypothetical protein
MGGWLLLWHKIHKRLPGKPCPTAHLRRFSCLLTPSISTGKVLIHPIWGFFIALLTNVWILLRWEFARLLATGPRRVDEKLFRLPCFSKLLIRSIEKLYDTISAISNHQAPQSVIY